MVILKELNLNFISDKDKKNATHQSKTMMGSTLINYTNY
jgi:hypothetical protein